MAHTSTAIGDAVAAIVAAMRARAGYRSPWDASTPGAPVFHSIEVGMQECAAPQAAQLLVVGDVGDPSTPTESGDSRQERATFGTRRAKTEEATIKCRAVAQTGDVGEGVVQAQWDAALAVVDAVDAELRADPAGIGPTLGLVPAYQSVTALVSQVTGIRSYLSGGTVVEVAFDIDVTTRL